MNYPKLLIPLGLSALFLTGCGNDDKKPPKPNTAPTATAASFTAQADTAVTGKLAGTDAEKDTLTFTLGAAPTKGTVKLNADGNFSYQPGTEFVGSDKFTFTVSDGVNTSAAAEVNLTVDLLQVTFSDYSRKAFKQTATDKPLPLNSRTVTQDVTAANAYDDLLAQ